MWLNPQFPADLVTFTGKILKWKLYFCAVIAIKVFAMVNTFVSTMANSSLTEKGDKHLKKQVS